MIILEGLSKQFRRHAVLNDIDLQIDKGDRVALVGSNGAGKTTLIRCLLGEYNHEGEVRISGLRPRIDRSEVLKRIGFVPQLPPPLKTRVGQLLQFAAGVSNSRVSAMESVIEALGLDPARVGSQPFNKLSGGQKQKILIGIALGRECPFLILDEPTANLDPEARTELFRLLHERQTESAMIISSHRLDEVASLVNRVVELDQGKVVLNDHVADGVDMSSRMSCSITLYRADDAFARAITDWGFSELRGGLLWRGHIAGPDRLRFLGMLSRYAALLKAVQIQETHAAEENVRARIA